MHATVLHRVAAARERIWLHWHEVFARAHDDALAVDPLAAVFIAERVETIFLSATVDGATGVCEDWRAGTVLRGAAARRLQLSRW